jgi:predicted Zn-dependent peptidase
MTGGVCGTAAAASRLCRVPALGPAPENMLPPILEHTTGIGLRVVAVRRPGVPLAEVRLRIPFASAEAGHAARAWLLAECILSRKVGEGREPLTELIQDLGASMSAGADCDQFLIAGTVLAGCLEKLLGLLVTALIATRYDEDDVATERARLLTRLQMARSRASTRAREILRGHLFGAHPYARSLPQVAETSQVTAADLTVLHERRLVPGGSALVLVGDIDPGTAVAMAERVMSGWDRQPAASEELPALPATAPAGPSRLFHREGSVQSSIRIGGPALRRDHPEFAALQLANLLYGGYFSGRLIRNIREEKGYTYSPRSKIEHAVAGSTLVAEADVATALTAPALLEMWYELGRLSTLRPSDEELDNARQYATGTLAMSIATQAGLASMLITLIGDGLELDWVREHPRRLALVTAGDIYHHGVHLLAPNRLAAVVIGDASQCEEPLQAFGPWETK